MNPPLFRSLLFLLLFSSVLWLKGQERVTTLGLQLKPIIVTDIGGSGPSTIVEGPLTWDIEPRTGLAWGMVIRRGITESISAEVGINRVERKYRFTLMDSEASFERDLALSYINYEIPIKGLVFVQLGRDLFLNNSLGAALDFFPSDVGAGDLELEILALRRTWVQVAFEANLGLEYRAKKSGYFYLGATFHNPFNAVADLQTRYRTSTEELILRSSLRSGYLTFDLRYFFNERPE